MVLWPIKDNGTEGNWQLSNSELKERLEHGYVKIGKIKDNNIPLSYLKRGSIDKILNEEVELLGHDSESGTVIVQSNGYTRSFVPGSQWNIQSHDATYKGTQLLSKFIGNRFDFPKSLYAVHDVLRFFVVNNPNALIVDFFAGSGTTLHAVNLLNAEDGGNRRCIMVTNNEVGESKAKEMLKQGLCSDAPEWEARGIAQYVTWPRTVCSIKGVDVNGKAIQGDYITTLTKEVKKGRTIKQLTFAGADALSTKQKKEIVGLLGKKKLPQSAVQGDCPYIASADYPIAILFDETAAEDWLEALCDLDNVEELYIFTANAKLFKQIKARIQEDLGEMTKVEPLLRPMTDGFAANCEFFKLEFLEKSAVAFGRAFNEILPLLWLKAGAKGARPEIAETEPTPEMLVLPENNLAVLTDEDYFPAFKSKLAELPKIEHVFLVTDSFKGFQEMALELPGRTTYQLYRDYLDNFRININNTTSR